MLCLSFIIYVTSVRSLTLLLQASSVFLLHNQCPHVAVLSATCRSEAIAPHPVEPRGYCFIYNADCSHWATSPVLNPSCALKRMLDDVNIRCIVGFWVQKSQRCIWSISNWTKLMKQTNSKYFFYISFLHLCAWCFDDIGKHYIL